MKKRTLTALILSALAAGQLISLSAHAATKQLNVWEDIKKSVGIQDAVKDFEQKYDVKVNVQEMPYAQQLEKLRLDGPAGIGPDVLVIPNDQLGGAVVQGLLAPLNLDKEKVDAFTPASINAFRLDNTLYGVPKAVETLVLIYNKDLIDKPLQSLPEWLDYSKKQREQNKYGLLAKFDQIYYSWGAIGPMGGYLFGKNDKGGFNPKDIGLNKPGAVEAVTFLKKFYSEGVFPSGILGDNGLNAIDSLFTEKKAAAVINGPWAFQPYEAAGVNYGVVPLPNLPDGKPMSSFLGVKGYVVSTWSKDKQLAQQFLEFINQPQYVKTRYIATREIPAQKAMIDDPMIKNDEKASAVAVQAARATAMPGIPEMGEVWGPANAALELSLTGKQEPQAALDAATKQIHMQVEAMQASNQ
ncbi:MULTISPECIES: extracellular solute-binding protein [Enterobacteriaceae]|jgi:arabinogalactan oligomer/maltooligosaccharide transport system substrate-binding protein|uniref:extracellular solute-binding protein n=1 Tax=Enterobacteriaceae TaxID=543 RepID=UPI00057BF3EF|nr:MULTISPECIES: extracellular solute-binding protein [Enterobacteriaceae]AUU91288.1 cyclodextrin-binding protein [Enterobacteriaceae bacterium ENNIH3]AUV08693.1 cyclodextrin-binding protein [Enterobacteriaceae bacterium ENNIH2]MDU4154843.1 extracellular solute-binding protein [Enterobacteriaceae bacterium]PTA91012.1 cyclodextrin-binding protein [Kluyvera sp. Nf5]PWF50275.1 cyclodextrin-binding protein [[Kluyvera] intestini]PXW51078.1 carbohydrate ABC transporter substrate-binding protein (CU